MRICWDNIEGLECRGNNLFRRKREKRGKKGFLYDYYIYKEKCKNCGEPFLARTSARKMAVFCSHACSNTSGVVATRENHQKWKGEKLVWENRYGGKYVYVYNKPGFGRRREHTVIAENVLGRKLKRGECVHHIDMDGTNNSHDNLIICSNSYHNWLHNRMARAWVEEHIKA